MILFQNISNMSKNEISININISEEQAKRIEQMMKEKSKYERKRSSDRRGSINLKNIKRESSNFNKEELSMVQNLASYFGNVEANIDLIDQFCQKRRIHFLEQLKCKMQSEEYKTFLSNLQLYKLPEGGRLQEQGKFHSYHYIIIDGCIGAFQEKKIKQEEKQYIQRFQYEIGELLISNMLQTHKANPYTNKAKRLSLLLRFNDDVFNRYLKKNYVRESDELATTMAHTLVFRGISVVQIKKIIPYCTVRRFRYNQLVYEEGDLIKHLYLILKGEAQIGYEREDKKQRDSKKVLAPLIPPNFYKINHQLNDKKQIKLVKVGKKELFGLEAFEVFQENYYQHHVRVASDSLKTFAIGLDILYQMELQNPILQENLNSYLKKINQAHSNLLLKNQNIGLAPPQKKKKKKRKMRRRTQNSLEWWGLAAKIEDTKKYKLPTPPKSSSMQSLKRKQPLDSINKTSKLDYFKRRLFEDEIQALEEVQSKENFNMTNSQGLIPKLQKVKIRMINTKPKVINNAERIKRKLVEYAKANEIFCDKLQLE